MNDTILGRLRDLFLAPGQLMDNVKENPNWWHPGLLIFLIMIGFSYLINPIAIPEQVEGMKDSTAMRMLPAEVVEQQYEDALNLTPLTNITSAIGAGFFIWMLTLAFGFVLGFFTRMSGGEGSFKQALGVVSWASIIPFGLASLVKLPLILKTESVAEVSLGLATLIPGVESGSKLFVVLNSFGDFFTWWGIFVLVIGFERVFKMSRGAAAVSVILPWMLLTAIMVGFSLISM